MNELLDYINKRYRELDIEFSEAKILADESESLVDREVGIGLMKQVVVKKTELLGMQKEINKLIKSNIHESSN